MESSGCSGAPPCCEILCRRPNLSYLHTLHPAAHCEIYNYTKDVLLFQHPSERLKTRHGNCVCGVIWIRTAPTHKGVLLHGPTVKPLVFSAAMFPHHFSCSVSSHPNSVPAPASQCLMMIGYEPVTHTKQIHANMHAHVHINTHRHTNTRGGNDLSRA